MNLSVIAERIEYIPLERTDQATLGHVYDFEITDDYFFIDFEKDLFRFGSDGKFLTYFISSGNCLYSIIDGEEFARYYRNASETAGNATKYLRQMAPILDAIDEFSNPVVMKVYLK